jgi:hypothetical protein
VPAAVDQETPISLRFAGAKIMRPDRSIIFRIAAESLPPAVSLLQGIQMGYRSGIRGSSVSC